MTREQSVVYSKRLIRSAKNGKEVAEAFLNHFRQFRPDTVEKTSPYDDALSLMNAPLLDGLKAC